MRKKLFYLPVAGIILFWSCNNSADPGSVELASPLFQRLPANESGVTFTNRINEDEQINILTYEYLYNGGGVAIGDINNDGLPDLYFSATNGSNKLYLNKGKGSFADITTVSGTGVTSGFKTGVTMADVNADGWLDIYVCRTGKFQTESRTNLLFINQQDGTFQDMGQAYGIADASFSNQAIFFDYDNDGDLDLYLVNHPIDFKNANNIVLRYEGATLVKSWPEDLTYFTDCLYRNDGGTFTNISAAAGINNYAYGLSATLIDVNEDGWLDVYVANDYVEPDYLYVNQGDGTFQEQLAKYIRKVSHNSMGSDVADYNNDGHEDIIVLDMLPEDNYRQKLLANVMKYDRYNTQLKYGFFHQQMRNMLQLNNGNGSFSEIGQFSGVSHTDWSWGPLFADFDLDGWKDLYIANGYRRDITNLNYMNYTLDSLNKAGGLGALRTIYDLLNKVPETPIQNYMFRNNHDLTFTQMTNEWGLKEKSFSNGAAMGDLDADGDMDLVVNNVNESAFIYLNQAADEGARFLRIKLQGESANTFAVGTTVTVSTTESVQSQRLVPTRGYMSSVEPILLFGLGKSEEAKVTVNWSDGRQSILANISANQTIVINQQDARVAPALLAKPTQSTHWIKEQDKLDYIHEENEDFIDFKREPLLPHGYSNLGPALAAADFNGDGRMDLFLGGAKDRPGAVYFGTDAGSFVAVSQPSIEADKVSEDVAAICFDANGDSFPDLFVISGGSEQAEGSDYYRDRLYVNDRHGNLKRAPNALPDIRGSGSVALALDGDGDGDKDLFIGGRVVPGRYPENPRSFWLENNGGTFTDVTNEWAPQMANVGMVTDAIAIDINEDGKEDVALVGEWMPVQVWQQNNSGFSKMEVAINGPNDGWWFSLDAADIDGDGDMDLLAGNMGLNTQYTASPTQPSSVYYADFDSNGALDAIITTAYADGIFPVPTRDLLVDQWRRLRSRLVRYDVYAQMTIDELLTQEEIQRASIKQVDQLASCWLRNDGNGTYTILPLPADFQWSTIQDFAIINTGESTPWIMAAGNWRCTDVLSGKCDAGNGVMARWNANAKGWEVIPLQQSGWFLPGEVRRMAVLTDNGKRIVVAQNNEPAEIWRWQE